MDDKLRDLTIIIKTFNRFKILIRLLNSIESYYPEIPIIILNDGRFSLRRRIKSNFSNLNISLIETKFDIGVSRGRNILLNLVDSDFFLLCDDDFELHQDSNLVNGLNLMKNGDCDILGGLLFDIFEFNSLYSFATAIMKPKKIIEAIYKTRSESSFLANFDMGKEYFNFKNIVLDDFDKTKLNNEAIRTDITNQFYIAKTSAIKKIGGWIPEELKTNEHISFFVRAKIANLKVGFTRMFSANHIRYIPMNYLYFRLLRLKKINSESEVLLEELFTKLGMRYSDKFLK